MIFIDFRAFSQGPAHAGTKSWPSPVIGQRWDQRGLVKAPSHEIRTYGIAIIVVWGPHIILLKSVRTSINMAGAA